MDNKITKKRISNLFSYDWVFVIVLCLIVVLLAEFVYAFLSVKLTPGQKFRWFYDEGISDEGDYDVMVLLTKDQTLSYDVINAYSESNLSEANMLEARVAIQEVDIFITHCREKEDGLVPIKTVVDNQNNNMYTFEKLLCDAENYLIGFLKDDFSSLGDSEKKVKIQDQENLSVEKIYSHFDSRMAKDNRFRTATEKAKGRVEEEKRIFDLVKEVNDFRYLLEVGDQSQLFYRYTRYSQLAEYSTKNKDLYETIVQMEVDAGRGDAIYGLRVENLKGIGKDDPSKYFKISGEDTSKDVIISVFDFLEYQQDLQFECISFINTIVRACSDVYDGR